MDVNVNDLRAVWTLVSFVVFLAIVGWAYSSARKRGFDEAAQLPLDDER